MSKKDPEYGRGANITVTSGRCASSVGGKAMPPSARVSRAYARHVGNTPNEARRHTVRVLYESGLSLRMVADRIGVTYQAVHALLQRSGVVLRPRGCNVGTHSRHKK
jgi:hypothetical protein